MSRKKGWNENPIGGRVSIGQIIATNEITGAERIPYIGTSEFKFERAARYGKLAGDDCRCRRIGGPGESRLFASYRNIENAGLDHPAGIIGDKRQFARIDDKRHSLRCPCFQADAAEADQLPDRHGS
jgi:hypothetical protein